MKQGILLCLLVISLVLLRAEAGRKRKKNTPRPLINCDNIKTSEICLSGRERFPYFNGCTRCECGDEVGSSTCSPSPVCQSAEGRRAVKVCAKLLRKIHRLVRRARNWPIRCLRDSKVCRKNPGASFFDGCRQCQCQTGSMEATCTDRNSCAFFGTRGQYKRFCKERRQVTPLNA